MASLCKIAHRIGAHPQWQNLLEVDWGREASMPRAARRMLFRHPIDEMRKVLRCHATLLAVPLPQEPSKVLFEDCKRFPKRGEEFERARVSHPLRYSLLLLCYDSSSDDMCISRNLI
jgi:hypothetical protein